MNKDIRKREATGYILGCILAANFSVDELEYFSRMGLISPVLTSRDGESYDRGEGQKLALAHMSRFPYDDKNDLLMAYGAASSGDVITRQALGPSGKDSFFENATDLLASVAGAWNALKTYVGFDKNDDRILINRNGEVGSFVGPGNDDPNAFELGNSFMKDEKSYGVIVNANGAKQDPFGPLSQVMG